ncbi:MAG TPA: hypothetical protein VMU75_00180 [Acidimicrobiales bacterium]|nr:hypothetical protein [Acidimicrobiales bacterium]
MAVTDEEPRHGEDWAARAATLVESFVEAVRDRSVRPIVFALRALLVGLVSGALATVVLVVTAVGLVRLLTDLVFGGRVWASYLLLGGIFAVAGAFLLRRSASARRSDVGT